MGIESVMDDVDAAVPGWLRAAQVPDWPTELVGGGALRVQLPVRRGWAATGPPEPTGAGATQTFRGPGPADYLVIEVLTAAQPGADLTQWVTAGMVLTGFPISAMLDASPRLQEFGAVPCPGYAPTLGAEEAHAFAGTAAVPAGAGPPTLAQLYLVLARRGTTAWKIALSYDGASAEGTTGLDHTRAGATFGYLQLGTPIAAGQPVAIATPTTPLSAPPPDLAATPTTALPSPTGPASPRRGRRVVIAAAAVVVLGAVGVLVVPHRSDGGGISPVSAAASLAGAKGCANGRILFSSQGGPTGGFQVYAMNADGSGRTRLTNDSAGNLQAVFSPDGSRIAYSSGRDGNNEVYVMNADGSGQTRLTHDPGSDGSPAFSPDGTRIAFTSNRDGNGEVYVMNADGSGQTRLTNTSADDFHPVFSPDGSRIAFSSTPDARLTDIWVMNADGSMQTRLTDDPEQDSDPMFSPDGTKIAFISSRDGYEAAFVMKADGTGQHPLSKTGGGIIGLTFSPDGTKFAYSAAADPDNAVFVIAAGSGKPVRVTDQTTENYGPVFSPDGTKMAFTSQRDGDPEEGRQDVYVMNADGSGQTRLTPPGGGDSSVYAWGVQPQAAGKTPCVPVPK